MSEPPDQTPTKELPAPDTASIVGGIMGLGGFTVCVLSGMLAEGEPASVLWRGIVAMTICYGVGWLIGAVGMTVVRSHIETYRQERPIPSIPSLDPSDDVVAIVGEAAQDAQPLMGEAA